MQELYCFLFSKYRTVSKLYRLIQARLGTGRASASLSKARAIVALIEIYNKGYTGRNNKRTAAAAAAAAAFSYMVHDQEKKRFLRLFDILPL